MPSACFRGLFLHLARNVPAIFNMVSSSVSGTRFLLAGSCLVDGVTFCWVTATRGTKVSVEHVIVILPSVDVGLPPGCPE